MIRQRNFQLIIAMAALLGCLASPVLAERRYQRTGRVNNVGMGMIAGWGGALRSGGNSIQLPSGSGNFFKNDVWLFSMTAVRDLDGDGSPEDTSYCNKNSMAGYAGLNYNRIEDLAGQGLNMETATSERAGTDISQIWSSLDPGNLDSWPWEAREPKSATGTPVIRGAETLVAHTGDTFNAWYNNPPPIGWYMCWSLYFLDFGESNNMVYGNVWMQNSTHYFKFNDNLKDNVGATLPDGHKWFEFSVIMNLRAPQFAGYGSGYNYAGWAFHPEKGITAHYSREPTNSSFSPPEPPVIGFKMLKMPEHNGETMRLANINTWDHMAPFGFEGTRDMMTAYSSWALNEAAMGKFDMFPGAISPFTGKGGMIGWPGMLEPDEPRYNQWLWGGDSQNTYTMYSALHDFEARDSTSFDFVIMVTPANGKSIIVPELTTDNIDSPVMQDAFLDQERYADVAAQVNESGYLTPATPLPPPLTIIPGDRQVTITWGDINAKTPDPYYAYVNAEGLDPNGYYREYDLEGFRIYRSFVGPNDSHSELLGDFNMSDGNIRFHYIDRMDDDNPFFRMTNGMKVWYAVVPYDKNYDTLTGDMFSLPDTTSGKTWNRPGQNEYTVLPRSEASNFKAASLLSFSYVGPATTPLASVELAGDGNGNVTEAPKWLVPPIGDVTLKVVNNEKITSAKTVYIETDSWWHTGGGCWGGNRPYGTRYMKLVTDAGEVAGSKRLVGNDGDDEETVMFYDVPASDGVSFALDVTFLGTKYPATYRNPWLHTVDVGTYAGAVETWSATPCHRYQAAAPNQNSLIRNGRFTITWKTGPSGGMTVDVQNVTRGAGVPHVAYQDEIGWGFVTTEGYGDVGGRRVWGTYYEETFIDKVPQADRTALMESEIPVDYSELFGVWVNGMIWWVMDGMPADGTVMTIDNAWGSWNADLTVFTQKADLPFLEDRWQLDIQPSSLNPEDADLSKIKVVPNPYIATSFLDISPMNRRIEFTNLPDRCTIRIYSLGGNLVNVLNHIGSNRQGWGNYLEWDRLTSSEPREYTGYDNHGGTEPWALRNRFGQTVASGLYFYHVTDSRGETHTGKFYVVL